MDQRELKLLLQEAAEVGGMLQNKASLEHGKELVLRMTVISDALLAAVACAYQNKFSEHAQVIVDHIIKDTLIGDPSYFPKLFPFFATVCGDRPGSQRLAGVDWKVAKES